MHFILLLHFKKNLVLDFAVNKTDAFICKNVRRGFRKMFQLQRCSRKKTTGSRNRLSMPTNTISDFQNICFGLYQALETWSMKRLFEMRMTVLSSSIENTFTTILRLFSLRKDFFRFFVLFVLIPKKNMTRHQLDSHITNAFYTTFSFTQNVWYKFFMSCRMRLQVQLKLFSFFLSQCIFLGFNGTINERAIAFVAWFLMF